METFSANPSPDTVSGAHWSGSSIEIPISSPYYVLEHHVRVRTPLNSVDLLRFFYIFFPLNFCSGLFRMVYIVSIVSNLASCLACVGHQGETSPGNRRDARGKQARLGRPGPCPRLKVAHRGAHHPPFVAPHTANRLMFCMCVAMLVRENKSTTFCVPR